MPYSFLLSNIHVYSTVCKLLCAYFMRFWKDKSHVWIVWNVARDWIKFIQFVALLYYLLLVTTNAIFLWPFLACCLFGAVDSIGQTKLRYVSCDTNDIRMKMIVIFISGFVSWGQLCRYILVCISVDRRRRFWNVLDETLPFFVLNGDAMCHPVVSNAKLH